MSEEREQEKGHQKRVAIVAALTVFVCVILLGTVVYFALDQVYFERLRERGAPEAPEEQGLAPPDVVPFIFFEF